MAEWPIASVSKTDVGQPTVGSNPTSSELPTEGMQNMARFFSLGGGARRALNTVFAYVLLCLILASTTACTKNEEPTKEVRLYFQAEPFSFDPRIGGDRRSQLILRPLFEGLARIGKDGKPELALAKSVSLSEDQTVYTFHLRPSVWSNGLPVTAHDFEWAWKSALAPTFPAPFCYIYLYNHKRLVWKTFLI